MAELTPHDQQHPFDLSTLPSFSINRNGYLIDLKKFSAKQISYPINKSKACDDNNQCRDCTFQILFGIPCPFSHSIIELKRAQRDLDALMSTSNIQRTIQRHAPPRQSKFQTTTVSDPSAVHAALGPIRLEL
jgi:hypothetical protein